MKVTGVAVKHLKRTASFKCSGGKMAAFPAKSERGGVVWGSTNYHGEERIPP